MAIRGVSLSEQEEVILPHDPGHPDHPEYKKAIKEGREPESPTKFFIGNLTKGCRIEIGDMSASPTMKDGGVTMDLRNTKRAYAVVQRGLMGWENMLDSSGKPVKFEQQTIQTASGFVKGASDASMLVLSGDEIRVLAKMILDKNGMTRQVEGNFGGQSPQSGDLLSALGNVIPAQQTSNVSEDAPPPQ